MRVAFVGMSATDVATADTSKRHFGSDEIGFGVTSSNILRRALTKHVDVVDVHAPPSAEPTSAGAKLDWIYRQYDQVRRVAGEVDAILVFHIANTFAGEIKRMLIELRRDIPLVGYTHGSHWDPTDLYRFEFYDGMEFVDLGNLTALDRVLLVSDSIKAAILATVADLNPGVSDALAERCRVVGLPIDHDGIDRARAEEVGRSEPRLVFNHSFTTAKRPEVFLDVCDRLLERFPALQVDITRRPSLEFEPQVHRVACRYPKRVHVWNDLPTAQYQALLTSATVHVSCASHESFGVSTVEAMYAGACSIVPATGAYVELMDGIAAALYDGSAEELARRVAVMLTDETLRRRTADRQRRRAAMFSGERVAEAVTRVLVEAAEDG